MYRFIRNGIQRVHLIYNVSHKVVLNNFLSSTKIGKTILPTIDAGEKGGVLSIRSLRRRETGEWELLLKDKEGTLHSLVKCTFFEIGKRLNT